MGKTEALVYVDTSVLVAMTGEEAHSRWALTTLRRRAMVSSAILRVELARFAHRMNYGLGYVRELESRVSLVNVDDAVIAAAVAISGEVKTLDSLHVGTWARLQSLGVTCPFVTADRKQALAAASMGATVIHPYGELR
ncbi:hypothetical protein HMPREF3104_03215 [Corynebacterium sp. HMSC30G07]|uniref:PIN domain-containing protein n=1 Tax=Corynebacterium sp. HMSC30G07 TaxID=1581072 RepID=UPI0008A5F44A|nr:PIN domain-containing protein [Corynebacterium sp. HMSC30G07]OFT76939.1 hypothetical protein HMPREF3104_03215 [Corynebacterium sp. HMSC30G07]